MKKLMILFFMVLPTQIVAESRIKVAVIDTGISFSMKTKDFMCKDGILAAKGLGSYDSHGH